MRAVAAVAFANLRPRSLGSVRTGSAILSMCFPKIMANAPSPSGKDASHVTTGECTPAVAAYPPPTMAGPQTK